MSVTYVKQRDRFRCGPVAIINALRWAGKDVGYKNTISQLCRKCKCKAPSGSAYVPFNKTLRKEGRRWFRVRFVARPTLEEVETSLQNDCALVWNFKHHYGRHYALITQVSVSGKTFDVANFGEEYEPVTKIGRETLKQILRQHDRAHCVWVLSRIER